MPDWTPERVVDLDLARSLLAAARPDLADLPLRPLGEGFDNTCFLAGDDLVLRFPRRAVALPLLDTERRVLAAIAPHLPVVVPEVRIVGAPGHGFPWPWLGVRLVPGTTADHDGVDVDPAELGGLLRALHALDAPAPPDTWARTDVARRRPRLVEALADLRARGELAVEPDLDVAPWPVTEALCHGDVYARHLVVGADGRLAGVIDWGDCHRGDRVKDLAGAWVTLPPARHDTFLAAYGPVDPAEWAGARWIARFHSVAVLRYGLDRPDPAMARIGRRALAWIDGG